MNKDGQKNPKGIKYLSKKGLWINRQTDCMCLYLSPPKTQQKNNSKGIKRYEHTWIKRGEALLVDEFNTFYGSRKIDRRMETTQQNRESYFLKVAVEATNEKAANSHCPVTHTNTLQLQTWFYQVLQKVRIKNNNDNGGQSLDVPSSPFLDPNIGKERPRTTAM